MSASRTPDLAPERGERRGEVDRQRRLADAALARRDRDHARRRRRAGCRVASAPPRSFVVSAARSSGVITSNCERDGRRRPAASPTCSATCSSKLERSGQPTTVSAIVTVDRAAVDLDVAHHVELGHRAPQLGVDHAAERLDDLLLGGHQREGSARAQAARRAAAELARGRDPGPRRRDRAAPRRTGGSSGRSIASPRSRTSNCAAAMSTERALFSETTPSTRPAARWQSVIASEPMTRSRWARPSKRAAFSATYDVVVASNERISSSSFGSCVSARAVQERAAAARRRPLLAACRSRRRSRRRRRPSCSPSATAIEIEKNGIPRFAFSEPSIGSTTTVQRPSPTHADLLADDAHVLAA